MTARTLMELANAPRHPSPLDRAALVVIDVQMEYVTGKLPLPGAAAAVAQAVELVELARRHGAPVIHIVHHAAPGAALFNPGGPFAAIVPEIVPGPGEPVIAKGLPNAFAGTRLHETVRELGRSELIIAGFMTHMCVSATARAALDLGYRSTVVAAASATRALPSPIGGADLSAERVHEAALAELADRFAIVVPSAASWSV